MANYACRNGHKWKGRSSLSRGFSPAETFCPQPDCGLAAEPKMKHGSGFKAESESSARREARDRFNAAVLAYRCFYSAYRSPTGRPRRAGHVCAYPFDAHHIVEKSFIESNYGDLDEADLLAILFDPRIGAPLCRGGHDGVKSLLIYWDEVSPECIEFCTEVDQRWLDVPMPAGYRRSSMFEELRRVCPERDLQPPPKQNPSAAIGLPGRSTPR